MWGAEGGQAEEPRLPFAPPPPLEGGSQPHMASYGQATALCSSSGCGFRPQSALAAVRQLISSAWL